MRTVFFYVDCQTKNEVFAQARNAESEAEELLVDDGWKVVEIEPETVSVNGNGNGNGHHDPFGIGPTVELVPVNAQPANGNGHAPAPVNSLPRTGYGGNGNGHHDGDAPEPQQSLFSWAEFMAEEPVKPKGRKTQPATLSMFEWAMSMEQEREEEPVGAGR